MKMKISNELAAQLNVLLALISGEEPDAEDICAANRDAIENLMVPRGTTHIVSPDLEGK